MFYFRPSNSFKNPVSTKDLDWDHKEKKMPTYLFIQTKTQICTSWMQSLLFLYLAHVIEQPIFPIPNLEYLQLNFYFDFFNDSENSFWGFSKI